MTTRGILVLVASMILCFALGSVHAFSVFLGPLAELYHALRAEVSLAYGMALVSITAAVTFGHHLYARLPGWGMAALVAVLAAAGAFWAGHQLSVWGLLLGYGLTFGIANGLGYGYGLQISAQANPGREGLAMGLVTASYALGATAFPVWFQSAMAGGGFPAAMRLLTIALLCAGLGAGGLYLIAKARFQGVAQGTAPDISGRLVAVLWLSYGMAVAAGLMATGHATGIAEVYGIRPEILVLAPIVLAICNMVGSLVGGAMADRLGKGPLLFGLPLLSAAALVALAAGIVPHALAILGVVGFVYGAIISVYPAVIAQRFGVAAGVWVYGRVFTAWAVAGLFGPLIAGMLYDETGTYSVALWIAAGLAIGSAVMTLFLPQQTGARAARPPNR